MQVLPFPPLGAPPSCWAWQILIPVYKFSFYGIAFNCVLPRYLSKEAHTDWVFKNVFCEWALGRPAVQRRQSVSASSSSFFYCLLISYIMNKNTGLLVECHFFFFFFKETAGKPWDGWGYPLFNVIWMVWLEAQFLVSIISVFNEVFQDWTRGRSYRRLSALVVVTCP